MRGIRLALILVSLATLGLVALLAWRANQGLAAERAVRHEAVAERAFEEMERTLNEFLAREEARPFEHYAHTLATTGERSPLAGSLEPFVVGSFQVDFQGAVTTPLEGPDKSGLSSSSEAARHVRSVVNALWSTNAADAKNEAEPSRRLSKDAARRESGRQAAKESSRDDLQKKMDRLDQAPGTTRIVSGPGVSDPGEGADEDAAGASPETRSAFDVLGSLNRAVDDRAERKQKVAEAPKAAVYPEAEVVAEARVEQPLAQARGRVLGGEARANLAPEAYAREGALLDEAAEQESDDVQSEAALPAEAVVAGFRTGVQTAGDTAPARRSAPAPAAAAPPATLASSLQGEAVRVTIDPMVCVEADAEIVLYRTVQVGPRGFRQGLVLDRAALGAWLEDRVIRSSGLARVASVSFDDTASPPAADRFVYVHRFAEPFDAVHARLALASLPGVASPGALYALVAVLLAVGAAGIFAVHRTASLAVGYAERRNNFVAAVSHELKTPLTAIRMYAEMLRDGLVPGEAKRQEYYATITDESERLSRLVDNVLEFSELEGRRRELSVHVGAIAPVLEEAAEKLAAHAAREGFAIEVDVEPDLPAVRFDRDALLQVVFNLVDNAIKYAHTADRKCVELEARRERGAVVVAVRDYGPGVSRNHEERIFEPFYRGESELTRTTKGTGIGLALVKELVERMGAAVSGNNDETGGFRVRLSFPIEAS